jgi:hypothetical protein
VCVWGGSILLYNLCKAIAGSLMANDENDLSSLPPPSDGHPVSPTMMGRAWALILLRAILQPRSLASNRDPALPRAKARDMST